MGKTLKWLVKAACALVVLIVVLLIAGFSVLNTSWLQKKLLDEATVLLTEKLQTHVSIDSVSIDLFTLDAKLYRLVIDDRQDRRMLQMDYLQADVDIFALMNNEVNIGKAQVEGLQAWLHKVRKDSLSPDTVANFQFVIDAFKSDKKKKDKAPTTAEGDKKKQKLAFVMNKFTAKHIAVKYNEDSIRLDEAQYAQPRFGKPKGSLENLYATWQRTNKKGELVTNEARVGQLEYTLRDGQHDIALLNVNYKTNNHRPRRNASKPKRGFFDAGHFDFKANLHITIDSINKGNVHGHLHDVTAIDSVTGIDVRRLECEFHANKEGAKLHNLVIEQGAHTRVEVMLATLRFPNKHTGEQFKYFTTTINGTTQLRDIARPFAPVLRKFELPLKFSTRMEGNAEGMRFHNVRVNRPDGSLKIKAKGYITGLKNKYDLHVHFDINDLLVRQGEAEHIINQFTVRKFMMKQLNALGNIHYTGALNVIYKQENFQGLLRTKAGNINFYFQLDELNKYVTGRADADGIQLGRVMDMPDIGPVTVTANFKFDYSKPRTALMRKRLGGKLPIGEVKAHVTEASYKFVKVRNVDVEIVSNGAVAEGWLKAPGKLADISCTFSFTNTNEMKKTKVKPGIHFNLFGKKKDNGDDDEREHQKQLKREAKEKAKQERAAAKAEKKAAKEKAAAAKAEEKAARKAAKAEEKAAKKQRKAEEKAARKAEKEKEKQRKAEEKAAHKAAKKAQKEQKAQADAVQ